MHICFSGKRLSLILSELFYSRYLSIPFVNTSLLSSLPSSSPDYTCVSMGQLSPSLYSYIFFLFNFLFISLSFSLHLFPSLLIFLCISSFAFLSLLFSLKLFPSTATLTRKQHNKCYWSIQISVICYYRWQLGYFIHKVFLSIILV